jgi:hypothetical protein
MEYTDPVMTGPTIHATLAKQGDRIKWNEPAGAWGLNFEILTQTVFPFMTCPTRGQRKSAAGITTAPYQGTGSMITFDYGIVSLSSVFSGNHKDALCFGGFEQRCDSIMWPPGSNLYQANEKYPGLARCVIQLATGPTDADGKIVTQKDGVNFTACYQGWRPRLRSKDILDGTSKTAMLSEIHLFRGEHGKRGRCPWVAPAGATSRSCGNQGYDQPPLAGVYDARLFAFFNIGGVARGAEDDAVNTSVGSWHPGVCQIAMADGAVRAMSVAISQMTLNQIGDRRDGQTIGEIP